MGSPREVHQVRKSRGHLAWVCAWLLGAMSLLGLCPLSALGQEMQPEIPPMSEPASVMPTEMEDPIEAPDVVPKKRRFLSKLGPRPVTPEQREEAERLRQRAAKYGTDPTAIVGRMQLSSTYYNLPLGIQGVDHTVRVDVPFRRDFLLRADMPFWKWSDPNRQSSTQGLSDLAVTAAWRAYNTPEYALLLGVLSTMPTASETGLGLGKYTVGPTIATSWFVPQWESFLIGLVTQQFSVGGDPARRAFNVSRATAQINTFWAERWWTIAQSVWQVDWERSAKSSMTLELEVGRNVVGRLGVFVRPGVGVFGRDVPGAYDWNVEAGVRYMFPSF